MPHPACGARAQSAILTKSDFLISDNEVPAMKATALALRDRGQLTLPKALRNALDLETGDRVRAVQIGDAIVLTPQRLELDALRKEFRRLMKKHGVTPEELLRGL
jgi:AbrB family looped-hinge helix DNA binding protein